MVKRIHVVDVVVDIAITSGKVIVQLAVMVEVQSLESIHGKIKI